MAAPGAAPVAVAAHGAGAVRRRGQQLGTQATYAHDTAQYDCMLCAYVATPGCSKKIRWQWTYMYLLLPTHFTSQNC
ncbi:hypothetical protein PR003_g30125 [Phytophthora rubi]|uniref:Uncharacterized protein n=1 Tax=Phytophthora rubi TaxID=129364 RepID=A0A6A4BHY4_9STRA|nr:hypothetical protein PR003_g30125 [Phytophthora rubi]